MLRFPESEQGNYILLKAVIVGVFVIVQAMLVGDLLTSNFSSSLVFSLPAGLAIAIACYTLLLRLPGMFYTELVVGMFAAGGLGMILGCWLDMDHAGNHGILSHHMAMSPVMLTGGLDLWQWVQASPLSYLGMFVGGNLGMWFFDGLRSRRFMPASSDFFIYAICNIGMFIGMMLGEGIAMAMASHVSPPLAYALMIGGMIMGMTMGMIVLLAIVIRSRKPIND